MYLGVFSTCNSKDYYYGTSSGSETKAPGRFENFKIMKACPSDGYSGVFPQHPLETVFCIRKASELPIATPPTVQKIKRTPVRIRAAESIVNVILGSTTVNPGKSRKILDRCKVFLARQIANAAM